MNNKLLLTIVFLLVISLPNVLGIINTNGLKHVYTFDNTTNSGFTSVKDEIGTMNFTGSTITKTTGIRGDAYVFSGSGYSKQGTFNLTGAVNATISLWIKYTSTTAYMNILWFNNSVPNAYLGTNWGTNGHLTFNINNGVDLVKSGTNNNVWRNVVLRMYTNKTYQLWVDGVYVYSQEAGSYGFNDGLLYIGNQPGQNRNYTGSIDEMYMYNRALNDTEILSLNSSFYEITDYYNVSGYVYNNSIGVNNSQIWLLSNTGSLVTNFSTNSSGYYFYSGLTNNTFYRMLAFKDLDSKSSYINVTNTSNSVNFDFYTQPIVSSCLVNLGKAYYRPNTCTTP